MSILDLDDILAIKLQESHFEIVVEIQKILQACERPNHKSGKTTTKTY